MLSLTIARRRPLEIEAAHPPPSLSQAAPRARPRAAADAQIIVRGGRVLRDGDTLDAAGVADGSELHLAATFQRRRRPPPAPASPPLPPPPPGPPSSRGGAAREGGGDHPPHRRDDAGRARRGAADLESALTSAMSDPKEEVRTAAASAFLAETAYPDRAAAVRCSSVEQRTAIRLPPSPTPERESGAAGARWRRTATTRPRPRRSPRRRRRLPVGVADGAEADVPLARVVARADAAGVGVGVEAAPAPRLADAAGAPPIGPRR